MDVSIIIPTYQMEHYLARAIRSALAQNFEKKKFEVIVVDDGSTDNTSYVLNAFEDEIKVISHKKNRGLAAARNTGLRAAKGKFVVNLDADDYIHCDLISVEALFLSLNNDFDAVSCDYYEVDEHCNHLMRKDASKEPIACGIMFRMDHLIDIGLYDEKFIAREEEDLRIRFSKKYKIYHIPLPLYRYRQHDKGITKDAALMDKYEEKIRKKHQSEQGKTK